MKTSITYEASPNLPEGFCFCTNNGVYVWYGKIQDLIWRDNNPIDNIIVSVSDFEIVKQMYDRFMKVGKS